MRRLIRPFVFAAASAVAIAGFDVAGRISAEPLTWHDLSGWLRRADPVDALGELARWIGLGLAVYVAIVSLTALLAETASLVRLPRLQGLLHGLVGLVAVPALRRRLLEFTTVATITATSLQVAVPGVVAAPMAPVTLTAETTTPAPPHLVVRGDYQGFGLVDAGTEQPAIGVTHRVRRGDTLWAIIADRYGSANGRLFDRVLKANPQIKDPNLILVGWEIELPEVNDLPATAPARPSVNGEATWSVVTVQPGDSLWGIVDRHYGHATGELVWATVEANPEIADPDLIYPGQQITLPPHPDLVPRGTAPVVDEPAPHDSAPAPTPPEVAPTTRQVPPPSAVEPSASTAATVEVPAPETGTVAEPTSSPPEVVHASTPSAVSPSSSAASIPTGGETQGTPPRVAAAEEASEPGVSLASLIGWTGGAGLAAGLLGLVARRRRRLPVIARHHRPARSAVELGVALLETDNLGAVDAAAAALRSLAADLRARPGEPTPVPRLLRLAGDEIELVWDVPCPELQGSWRTSDGGWSWTFRRAQLEVHEDMPSPCPCMVTIGRRDGADVLLNLESCGGLSIAGDPEAVLALTRSVATELSTSVFADSPTILVVGQDGLPGRPEHARAVDVAEAMSWLRERTDASSALLAQRRLTSLFALRARSRPQDAHEPVIVVVDPSLVAVDELTTLVDLANGDLGAIVVVAGPCPSITWTLRCVDGEVEVLPLGLHLDAVGLSPTLDCRIEELVPEADPDFDEFDAQGEEESPDADAVLADHLEVVCAREPEPVSVAEPAEPEWDVELKVLGQVRAVGAREALTPTELHLAIYLAFHRTGETSDTISTMVWPNGVSMRTITNAMAALRRKLGSSPDGEVLFPLGRGNQYIYRLSQRVITDWDRFITLTRRADGLPPEDAAGVLDHALEMIEGPPFRATSGYSWAYSDGTATLITETVKAVALRCSQLHMKCGEPQEARLALCQIARLDGMDVVEP